MRTSPSLSAAKRNGARCCATSPGQDSFISGFACGAAPCAKSACGASVRNEISSGRRIDRLPAMGRRLMHSKNPLRTGEGLPIETKVVRLALDDQAARGDDDPAAVLPLDRLDAADTR